MTDCTGYGFDVDISICTLNSISDSQTSDLLITFDNQFRGNFDETKSVTVTAWDGREVTIDVTSALWFYGFNDVGCSDVTASLTLTPTGRPQSCQATLTFVLNNCTGSFSGGIDVSNSNCEAGTGPHTITQVNNVFFSNGGCV